MIECEELKMEGYYEKTHYKPCAYRADAHFARADGGRSPKRATAGLADARGILDGKVSVTFTVQPVDETVRAGENAVFTVEARIDSSYSKELKYLWLDSTDVDPNADLSLKDIIALIAKSVGNEKTLVLENVSTADSGKRYKCIAYLLPAAAQVAGLASIFASECSLHGVLPSTVSVASSLTA